jgi:hypothetical protein
MTTQQTTAAERRNAQHNAKEAKKAAASAQRAANRASAHARQNPTATADATDALQHAHAATGLAALATRQAATGYPDLANWHAAQAEDHARNAHAAAERATATQDAGDEASDYYNQPHEASNCETDPGAADWNAAREYETEAAARYH